jgi:ABC-type phosphate/phosphonate transport system ATPase subunit
VIELLGIGVTDGHGGWLLHRVCTRLASGRLVAIVSSRQQERAAFLDTVAAVRVPEEGRAWVCGAPAMPDTARRIRSLVADVDLARPASAEHRTALWNVLAATGSRRSPLARLLRLPSPGERRDADEALAVAGLRGAERPALGLDPEERAALALACGLAQRPECLVVRGIERALDDAAGERFLARLGSLAASRRLIVLVALESLAAAQRAADRVLVIASGALVFDGPPAALAGGAGRGRVAALSGVVS